MGALAIRQIVVCVDVPLHSLAGAIDELRGPLRIVSASHVVAGDTANVLLVMEGDVVTARAHEQVLRERLEF